MKKVRENAWIILEIVLIFATGALLSIAEYVEKTEERTIAEFRVQPEMCDSGDENQSLTVGVMDIRQSEASKKAGYIDIKLNDQLAEPGCTYIVWVYKEHEEVEDYQFTLNNFTNWTMCPLPYNSQYLVIFKQNTTDYNASFLIKEPMENVLGFKFMNQTYMVPTKLVCCFQVDDVGNYLENEDCFIGKTTWVYWEDTSQMVGAAKQLRAEEENDALFAQNVCSWVEEQIEYDTAKLENRAQDKYFDYIVEDDTLITHRGVCSDMAGLMCVMLRSQGIPCQYVAGTVEGESKDGKHAWNEVYRNGSIDRYDPTNGHNFMEGIIERDAIK